MKKYIAPLGAAISLLSLKAQVFAATSIDPCTNIPAGNAALTAGCALNNTGRVIGFVVSLGFVLAIIIALFFLVYGGIKWITSGGDKAGVEAARNQIIAAVVGLIVVFLSFFILNLVLQFFGLNLFNLSLPTING